MASPNWTYLIFMLFLALRECPAHRVPPGAPPSTHPKNGDPPVPPPSPSYNPAHQVTLGGKHDHDIPGETMLRSTGTEYGQEGIGPLGGGTGRMPGGCGACGGGGDPVYGGNPIPGPGGGWGNGWGSGSGGNLPGAGGGGGGGEGGGGGSGLPPPGIGLPPFGDPFHCAPVSCFTGNVKACLELGFGVHFSSPIFNTKSHGSNDQTDPPEKASDFAHKMNWPRNGVTGEDAMPPESG